MYNFDEIWDEFNYKLLNHIKSMISNEHDAEDILQTVFIKIFKGIDKLEDKSAIKPWIYKITKNTIIDFYRKRKDMPVLPETLNTIKDKITDIDNMNDEISECIDIMIFDLPDKYKNVYNMFENKNMKHKEIAEELNISVSASKVRLKRAKDLFKKKLLECCDFKVDKYGNIIQYKQKNNCDGCNKKC